MELTFEVLHEFELLSKEHFRFKSAVKPAAEPKNAPAEKTAADEKPASAAKPTTAEKPSAEAKLAILAVAVPGSDLGNDQPVDEETFAAAGGFERQIEVVLLIRRAGVIYFAEETAGVAHRHPQRGVAVVDRFQYHHS